MCLLFLDFDGTVHPSGCPVDQLFCHLEMLEDWLRRRPSVDVVISSSWREVHPFDELQSYFSEDLQSRVIGVTPQYARDSWAQVDFERPAPVHVRHIEVLRWLAQSPAPGRRWAALDDQAELYRPGCAELVLIDGRVGLMPLDLARLDEALGFGRVHSMDDEG
jgi:hypothetical protein